MIDDDVKFKYIGNIEHFKFKHTFPKERAACPKKEPVTADCSAIFTNKEVSG